MKCGCTLAAGGLKATFTSSYIHTIIVYVVLALFCFKVYATSEELGSPAVVYQRLQEVRLTSDLIPSYMEALICPCSILSDQWVDSRFQLNDWLLLRHVRS